MGKFQYSPDDLYSFMEKARATKDPLIIAAADMVEIATGVYGRVKTLVLRHSNKLLTIRLDGRQNNPPHSTVFSGDDDRHEATHVAGDAAFAYDAAKQLDEFCDELIKELEARINNEAPPKAEL